MILKSFELTKIKLNNYKFYLFYGENEGLKDETIKNPDFTDKSSLGQKKMNQKPS